MTGVIPVSSTMRAGAAVAGSILAVGLLAACGGPGDTGDSGDSTEEPTVEVSGSDTSEATDVPTGYLPVPTGVTLTEPGTTLGYGDPATIAWRPRQDTVVTLELTVQRIDVTSYEESFEGWVVTDEMKGQVPYFVEVEATNVGASDVGDLLVPLYGLSSATSMYEPLDFREEIFEPCPGGDLPERLAPGRSAELCFVYLLPEAEDLTGAAFDPVGELGPITWAGEITQVDDGKKKDKKKDRKKRDRG